MVISVIGEIGFHSIKHPCPHPELMHVLRRKQARDLYHTRAYHPPVTGRVIHAALLYIFKCSSMTSPDRSPFSCA